MFRARNIWSIMLTFFWRGLRSAFARKGGGLRPVSIWGKMKGGAYSAARFLTQPRKAASGIRNLGLPERTHMARHSASSA